MSVDADTHSAMTLRRAQRREAQRLRSRRRLPALRDAGRDARGHAAATTASSSGAYTDRTGGVCPMLAAHRCGGRTDFRTFARAWDRFTGAGKRARSATERELRTLTAQLEASIWAEDELRAETLRTGTPVPARPRRTRATVRGWARSGAGTATATPCASALGRRADARARARARHRERRAETERERV